MRLLLVAPVVKPDGACGAATAATVKEADVVLYTCYATSLQPFNLTYTRKSCHFRSQKESDNEAQDKNRARV